MIMINILLLQNFNTLVAMVFNARLAGQTDLVKEKQNLMLN